MAIPTHIIVDAIKMNSTGPGALTNGGGINYIVETPTGAVYMVLPDINSDPAFIKSLDGGMSWSNPVALKACTCTQISIWYQRWTDPTGALGDKIWACYTDSGTDDVFIRSIDTANNDTLGTEYVVFAGSSTANGGALSISQMIGGNLICVGMIDAFTEPFARKSTDSGATWGNISAVMEATSDQIIMMPGWGADNQDGMVFYYDSSATEVSVKYYDDSANSWSEAALGTAIFPATSLSIGHMTATIDHTNSQNLIAFWTAVDTANADLRVFKCTQSVQTETATNVVLNSTDDQGFAGISISGSTWRVVYCGASNGSETIYAGLSVYYKESNDGGATWTSETIKYPVIMAIYFLYVNPIYRNRFPHAVYVGGSYIKYIANLSIPHTTYQLGM